MVAMGPSEIQRGVLKCGHTIAMTSVVPAATWRDLVMALASSERYKIRAQMAQATGRKQKTA